MANKKVSQLTSKPSVLTTDLFPIADPSTGQLYKTTISDLGTAIGSGVSSVNGLVGAVVLDTDDIQELVSPTNKWFTDTRARAALSASSPLTYNSGTGAFGIQVANGSQNGYLSSTDWTTFNSKQAALSGTGFVKISGTTISYDNTSYLPLTGGTLTGTLIGTRAEFTTSTLVDGILVNNGSGRGIRIVNGGAGYGLIINNETASSAIPFVIQKSGLDKIYFTDSGAGNFTSSLTASSFVKSGGTSSQYLMADGSVSTLTNPVTGTGTSGIVAKFNGTSSVTDSIIYDNGTRVSIGADVTTSNKFTAVASTTSSYAVVAQASGAANGFWATLSGTGEIFRGQTSGGSYFIINNGGNAFLNGNLNVGDFASTSYKLKVNGTANFTDDVTFDGGIGAINFSASTTITNTASSGYTAIYANGGGIYLGGSASTNHLSIVSSGAATFSNYVTATRFLVTPNGTSQVYNIVDASNTYAGSYTIQAGGGSSGYGGSFTMWGHSHASRAGYASAGISASSGGRFTVMNQAIGNGTDLFSVCSSGNVLINTTADNGYKLEVQTSSTSAGLWVQTGGTTGSYTIADFRTGTNLSAFSIKGNGDLYAANNAAFFFGSSALTYIAGGNTGMSFAVNGRASSMTLNSDGTVCIGRTTAPSSSYTAAFQEAIAMYITANGNNMINWFNASGTYVSSIVINSSTVMYNTVSDYRLKEDLKSFKGLDLVSKINVYDYKWKSDGTRMYGVVAHELQEVLPDAVSGFKDAVNPDGSIKNQGVDYSKIVPVMVQAIKDLKAELDTLKNK